MIHHDIDISGCLRCFAVFPLLATFVSEASVWIKSPECYLSHLLDEKISLSPSLLGQTSWAEIEIKFFSLREEA